MTLSEYITKIGDAAAAEKWGVKLRTIQSWRRKERVPRPWHADIIVENSPVKYAGIYGPEGGRKS